MADSGFVPGRHPIEAYGNGGFRFADMSHRGSILVLPTGVHAWTATTPQQIDEASLATLFALPKGVVELLFVGTGADLVRLPPQLRAKLRDSGIASEPMATAAAARTYNILLGEGRRVAAALPGRAVSAAPAPSGLDDAYAHCEAELKAADRGAWLAALFAPADRRPALHAFGAFLAEIGAVRDKVREPLAGELRLQWWTDAIEGEARGDVRGHPVAAALIDAVRAHHLSRTALTDLVEVKRQDLYDEPIATRADFDDWADRTEGAAFALRAAILCSPSEAVTTAARHAGRAAAVLATIRALGRRQAVRTEVRLPLDLLKAQGIGTAEVAVRRPSPAIRSLLEALRRAADVELDGLRDVRSAIPAEAGPAFLTVNVVRPLLRQLARRDYDPFTEPLHLSQWREQFILWRAARRNGMP